jgi:hypothetical protein
MAFGSAPRLQAGAGSPAGASLVQLDFVPELGPYAAFTCSQVGSWWLRAVESGEAESPFMYADDSGLQH